MKFDEWYEANHKTYWTKASAKAAWDEAWGYQQTIIDNLQHLNSLQQTKIDELEQHYNIVCEELELARQENNNG